MKYLLMFLMIAMPYTAMAKDKSTLIYEPSLPLSLAQKMASACIAWQSKNKISNLAIAIFNQDAQLIYFIRMDGVSIGVSEVAMKKAESASKFRFSTRDTMGWIQGNPGVATFDSIAGIIGGLPISTQSGKPLGGIGVSGASADDDEKCAQAALDAVKLELVD